MDEVTNKLEQIGARIRNYRLQKNISQQQLAEAVQVAVPRISMIENGKTDMRLSTFIRIAEEMDVSSDKLLLADVPEVREQAANEFSELMEDCNLEEIQALTRILRDVKEIWRNKK